MEKQITIKIPEEVDETLKLFHETLVSQGIQTTEEEVASFMLTEWCAKQSADIAAYGQRTSDVPLFRTKDNYLDSKDLFNLLKSDFMFENLYKSDEAFRDAYGEHLEREGAKLINEFSPGFIDFVNEHFAEHGIKAAEVLETTFQRAVAAARAWEKTFDSDAPGALRQFKYQDNELIKGDDLSKILLSEYEEIFQNLKSKLMDSTEKGEEVRISAEELSEFASML